MSQSPKGGKRRSNTENRAHEEQNLYLIPEVSLGRLNSDGGKKLGLRLTSYFISPGTL